jgi:hypothetical protein
VHLQDERSPYLKTPNELSNAMISNPAQYRLGYFHPSVKSLDLLRKRKLCAICKMQFRCYLAKKFWLVFAPAMGGRTSPFTVT